MNTQNILNIASFSIHFADFNCVTGRVLRNRTRSFGASVPARFRNGEGVEPCYKTPYPSKTDMSEIINKLFHMLT